MSKVHLPLKRAMRAALLVLLLCVAGVTKSLAQENHWVVDTHIWENSAWLICVVNLDGTELTSDDIEVGAFCGDEIRGSQYPMSVFPIGNTKFFALTVWGNNGDQITFKIYDHGEEMEIPTICHTTYTFVANDSQGTPVNPYEIVLTSGVEVTQSTNFAEGSNWWSSYVELGDNGFEMLRQGLGDNGQLIKSQSDGYASYLAGFGWYGSLNSINNESTYLIKTNADCEVSMTGPAANPEDHPITLNSGWNWIGFPSAYAMSIEEAFPYQVLSPSGYEIIKAQECFAFYYPGYGWFGTLKTVEPGMGLMYKSNNSNDLTFTYPSLEEPSGGGENITAATNHWVPNTHTYDSYISIVGVLKLDDVELQSEQYEVGAFDSNGECRGSARTLFFVEHPQIPYTYLVLLPVWGQTGDQITFKVYDHEAGQEMAAACYETVIWEYEDLGLPLGNFEFDFYSVPTYDITVTANPAEGGTVSGGGTYIEGATCTLTATPEGNYHFVNWTDLDGEVVSYSNPYYIYGVYEDAEYVANFSNTFDVTVSYIDPEEAGVISGEGAYEYGTECTLTAEANEGYTFAFWLTAWGEEIYENPYTFTVEEDTYMEAYFEPNTYEITASVNPEGVGFLWVEYSLGDLWDGSAIEMQHGDQLYVETWAKWEWEQLGYRFVSWTKDGEVVSTEPELYVTITESAHYVANFAQLFDIYVEADPFEGGTIMGSNIFFDTYNINDTCTLVATPNEGWVFYRWEEYGEVLSTEPELSFVVTENRTLIARFKNPNTIEFADPIVENICVAYWDTDYDGFLSYDEAAAVTDLGNAFRNNRSITTFDELQYFTGLTTIGEYEFYNCNSLTSIVIPTSVTSIQSYAFYQCSSLTSVVIPSLLSSIDEGAFYRCTSLATIDIPASVTSIQSYAFSQCSSLTSVVIPSSLSSIEGGTFYGCTSLATIDIPASVTFIGGEAFNSCYNLTSITIPTSVTYIGGWVFYDCYNLVTLNYNAIDCVVENTWLGNYDEIHPIINLNIGEGVQVIPDGFAMNCQNLSGELVIPNTVVSIGSNAFKYCSGLSGELNIPESVVSIGNGAFYDCMGFEGSIILPNSLISIGNQAFYNCYGFNGIVMGNSVETIGAEAFRNCGGFSGELTLPESLVSVGPSAFMGCNEISTVNYNAINCETMGNASQNVFGDCLSLTHIRIGATVESIPNYAFKPCFLVTDMSVAAINPPVIEASTFGAISRSIPVSVPFGSGDAYRSAQYWEEFFNITEDYSPSQYTCHWNVDIHQFEQSMTAVGIIQIDGVEQATDALEIGAFCGNECRGRQLLAYYPQVDRYLVFLTLYGEDGDEFSFRLYDHEVGMESAKGCSTHLTFVANDVIGTLTNPHPFNFVDMQQTQLAAGWNWWSSYVELTGIDGLSMVEESLGENGEIVKSQNEGYASYLDGFGWYGSLVSINNENTYLIKVVEDCEMSLEAAFVSPDNHPVTLNNGWNWIGYPTTTAMSLSTALSGFEASDDDLLKAQEGFAMYYTGLGWIGSLRTLTPGVGLMYKSNNGQSVTLTYPTAVRQEETSENITTQSNHWTVNAKAYPHNMNIVAVVEFDGTELQDESYEIAAFANGEVRGSARLLYIEPLNRYMAFLTVAGDEATELQFSLYNAETGEDLFGTDNALTYTTNAVVGSLNEPYIVSFRGTTGVNEFGSRVSLYPNPVASSQTVCINLPADNEGKVAVEVINAIGAVLSSETTTAPTVTVKVPETAGVYMLRISSEGNGTCFKKIVVR